MEIALLHSWKNIRRNTVERERVEDSQSGNGQRLTRRGRRDTRYLRFVTTISKKIDLLSNFHRFELIDLAPFPLFFSLCSHRILYEIVCRPRVGFPVPCAPLFIYWFILRNRAEHLPWIAVSQSRRSFHLLSFSPSPVIMERAFPSFLLD